MLNKLEGKDLLDIVSRKHYQAFHPRALELLKSLEGFKEIGIAHAHTYDKERGEYILNNFDFANKKVVDIGANVGFFSLQAALAGAHSVYAYESNEEDARFIQLIVKGLYLEDRIIIKAESYDFKTLNAGTNDLLLCLNVLHHYGRYFGDLESNLEESKSRIFEILNGLSLKNETCFYQMGYNWKGNEQLPLFGSGSKREMIESLKDAVMDYWEVINVAVINPQTMRYQNYSEDLSGRFDFLGEFGNRPLFLLRSKKV